MASDRAQGRVAASAASLESHLLQQIQERAFEVPLLPNVAAEVLSSTLDDQANAARLAELIQQDQSLAAHLLRVVNSPGFRGTTEIVALQQAIARLGMQSIREIALTVSVKGSLLQPGPYGDLAKAAWHHGLGTGLWAKEVARRARKNVEVAYLCGLLHNVGKPLLINHVSNLVKDMDPAQRLDTQELVGVLDRHVAGAGVMVAEEWRLPSAVALTIRYFGDFSSAQNAQDTVAVVDAGSYFAQEIEDGTFEVSAAVQQPVMQYLNFYPDDVEALLEHTQRIQETMEGMA